VRQITTDAVPNETVCVHITRNLTEPASQLPADTLADESKFEFAEGSSHVLFETKKGKSKIDFDQEGILNAIGTQFGSQSWINPYESG